VAGPIAGMEFVTIPSGSFSMGSDCGDTDEIPIHAVDVESFEIMTTEVTQGMWEEMMGATIHDQLDSAIFGYGLSGVGDTYPVYYVSWEECQDFVSRTNELGADYTYYLPTEAEWEYACRAGTTTEYYWGDDNSDSTMDIYCWYDMNSNSTSHPVGQKEPNEWGLYDMSGNVWEWCEDTYSESYDEAPTDGSAYVDENSGYRIFRGGARNWAAVHARSAQRWCGSSDDAQHDVGFRLARRKN